MTERPRVVVILTGGTIAMLPDPVTGAAVPTLDGAKVLARVEGLDELAEVEPLDWGLVPASHLRFAQILAIGALARGALERPDVAGAVIVQGTDVMEETAFAWDLLHGSAKPLVVVGAMRDAGAADYDGPANLRAAVRVAAGTELRGQGVMVVMGGAVLPADDVSKTHSAKLDAFRAPNEGPLGRVEGGALMVTRRRAHRRRLPSIPEAAAEPVELLTAVVSTDGGALRRAVAGGARGLVVEGTGTGNTDPDLLAAASEAMAAGIPVVLTSRCASGGVGPAYGFPGGGATWQAAGAIMGGTLSGPKARVALALGLGAGLGREALGALIEGSPRA
jgi:L-asparaginase